MGKSFIGYSLFVVVFFYLAMIYSNYGLYMILCLLLIIPFAALIYCICLRRKVRVRWGDMQSFVPRGSQAVVAVTMQNKSLFPTGRIALTVAITDVMKGKTVYGKKSFAIAGHRSQSDTFSIPMNHTGIVRVSVDKVRVFEPLGLFRYTLKSLNEPVCFIVMPEIPEVSCTFWQHNPYAYIGEEEYSKERPGDDPAEMFGFREYRPGDKQNRIHWNLTAKQDELIVKELGLPMDCATLVLFDMFTANDDAAINAAFDTLFGVSKALVSEGHPHTIAWMDGKNNCLLSERVTDPDQIAPLASLILQGGAGTREQSVISRYFAEHDRDRYKNIFYISSSMDTGIAEMLQASRADAFVTCMYVGDGIPEVIGREWNVYCIRPNHVAEDLAGKRGNE